MEELNEFTAEDKGKENTHLKQPKSWCRHRNYTGQWDPLTQADPELAPVNPLGQLILCQLFINSRENRQIKSKQLVILWKEYIIH